MEMVEYQICACPNEFKVKYVACTFVDSALSWLNDDVKTLTLAIANAMIWEDLNAMMLEEYYSSSEMQKIEQELWEHAMKGSHIATLCPGLVTLEAKKMERYIWGLSPQVQGMVISANRSPSTVPSVWHNSFRLGSSSRHHNPYARTTKTGRQ